MAFPRYWRCYATLSLKYYQTGVDMNITRIIGIALICLGLLGFVVGSFSFTTEETVADVGSVEVETKEETTIPVTPIASGFAVVIGAGLVYVGGRKS